MKKKAAIVTIIITSVIIWVLTAMAVGIKTTQELTFNEIIQEAGSGVQRVKASREPVYFLPVGKECEFTISVTGPKEIVPKISITLDEPEEKLGTSTAEPIFTTAVTNVTFNTGKLNVDNKKIFINFNYDSLPELDENKEYSVRYTIKLDSANYTLYNSIMIALAALCIIPLGISATYLFSLAENNEKAYDERQMRMRGKAAMSTLIAVIFTALGLGLISKIYNGFPLDVYDSMMIVTFVGIATFAITADRNDAYMGIRSKRKFFAVAFLIIGIIDLVMFFIDVFSSFTGTASSFVQGICCATIGIEMILKSIKDKKEALADEES